MHGTYIVANIACMQVTCKFYVLALLNWNEYSEEA